MPRALSILLIAACTAACGGPGEQTSPGPPPTSTAGQHDTNTDPCAGDAATVVRLGSPYRPQPPAYFTTTGDTLYITARNYQHGGIFDPDRGVTAIYIGPAAIPPIYNPQNGTVTPLTAELTVNEGEYTSINLAAGAYWLWTTTGGDVEVHSCHERAVASASAPPA